MADDPRTAPRPGDPESQWACHDPESQPSRDEVIGLGRLVAEARAAWGPGATPEAVVAELKARGVTADGDEIARCCADPYRAPGEV